jgi:hypothetical protein
LCWGHSYHIEPNVERLPDYHIEPNVEKLPDASTCKKVMVAALAILLFPITLPAVALGALLLSYSASHSRSYGEVGLRLFRVAASGLGITLTPFRRVHRETIQGIFNDPVAMERYGEAPRDITDEESEAWISMWANTPFGPFVVEENRTRQMVGWVMVAPTPFDGDFQNGAVNIEGLGRPAYWNADFRDEEYGIGTAGRQHLGLRAALACVGYARELKRRSIRVPCPVPPARRPEVEAALTANPNLDVRRNAAGEIDQIRLPLTRLTATAPRDSVAAYRIMENLLGRNTGERRPHHADLTRDVFIIAL